MLKKDVKLGGKYHANVSGKRTVVRIDSESSYGSGWSATNITTGRQVRIRTAGRLHGAYDPEGDRRREAEAKAERDKARSWIRACKRQHTYANPESFVEEMADESIREMLTDLKQFKWSEGAVVARGLIHHGEAELDERAREGATR